MTFKVRRKRCETCIYGPQSASRASVAELEAECADPNLPGHFAGFRACHKHENDVCCRGFWDAHNQSFDAGQISQRLGLVEFVE